MKNRSQATPCCFSIINTNLTKMCSSLGQAPSDVGSIILELLRATMVLLGVSMFLPIITS